MIEFSDMKLYNSHQGQNNSETSETIAPGPSQTIKEKYDYMGSMEQLMEAWPIASSNRHFYIQTYIPLYILVYII